MAWIDQPDGGRLCDVHQRTLKRGEVCAACVASPVAPGVDDTSAALDGEKLEAAHEYGCHYRTLWLAAEKLIKGTDLEKNIGAKLSAEAGKWATRRDELKSQVAQSRALREAIARDGCATLHLDLLPQTAIAQVQAQLLLTQGLLFFASEQVRLIFSKSMC